MTVERHQDEAIAWHVRLSAAAASGNDWALFTDWLESDPAHATAYDAVALADAELTESLAVATTDHALPQNDNEPEVAPWHLRRGLLAVAASVALAVLVVPSLIPDRSFRTFVTQPGQKRAIALPDGSQIVMNGGSRLELDSGSNRFARLGEGEAVFAIRHDASNPFIVETAASTLRDVGTIFNVRQDEDGLELTVSEGSVEYNPKQERVTVAAGNRLQISRGQPSPRFSKVDPAAVAGWQRGQLTYNEATLKMIAIDLERSLGNPVSVSKDVAGRRFTGVIRVEKDQTLLFRRLESLLGVRANPSGKGWQLTSE